MLDFAALFAERGDLAHLALFLWAAGASALLVWALKELAAAQRRFSGFVADIAALTRPDAPPPHDTPDADA